MATDDTRQAIIAATERLCAERSFADVTLRDIVAAADVNLAAINYHFGSKDDLLAEIYVARSVELNRERFAMLRAAESETGAAAIDDVLRALVEPVLRGCLDPDRARAASRRFMMRASTESIPPIRRIKMREVDHLRRFVAAMLRALPGEPEAECIWALHFALAMAHQTVNDAERLTKLSDGGCDVTDIDGIVTRIVDASVAALSPRVSGRSRPVSARPAR